MFRPPTHNLGFDPVLSYCLIFSPVAVLKKNLYVLPRALLFRKAALSYLSLLSCFGVHPITDQTHWVTKVLWAHTWISCRRRWFELKKVNQGENWSSPAAWCHWCWRDWVYRSKWAFVSRWCWPAIGSCRPKCCIPIACQILTFRRCLLPLGFYIEHENLDILHCFETKWLCEHLL